VALTNAYCTLAEVKAALAITDSIDDVPLEAAIHAASRMIDDYTGRFFYQDGTSQVPVSRYFTPIDPFLLAIDDIITVTEVAIDEDLGQTYGTVFAASDFFKEPINNPRRGWPFSRLLAIGAYIFPSNLPQSVRVKGVWGWSAVPYEVQAATQMQASRIFSRRQSPFGIAGSPDLGTVRLSARLDADVEALLRPFRKLDGVAI